MRIDEALSESKSLDVKFGAAVLHIEYRPPSYTIEEMVIADKDRENPERLVGMLQDLIVGWDLTRPEEIYDEATTAREVREVPVDINNPDDVRKYVKMNIIRGIITAIREDNEVTGE